MKKTLIEMLREIEQLEVADSPKMTVEDCLPFMCEKVEKALEQAETDKKALKLIFEKNVNTLLLELAENVGEYNERIVPNNEKLTPEEFELLKRWVKCQQ